jgi:hypothetical protein
VEEVSEGGKFKELLAVGRSIDNFMFQNPGEVMGDEDGVKAGGQGGIDVGLWGVSDHPGEGGIDGVVGDEIEVGGLILFCENFDCGEEGLETRTAELFCLLCEVALGYENKTVTAGCEGAEGGLDGWKELDAGGGDGVRKSDDASVMLGLKLGGGWGVGQLLKAGDEGLAKAGKAVAVGGDSGMLAGVELFADFFGGVNAMVEVGDEGGDGALEVNVVLPQCIVGVEEKGLWRLGSGFGHLGTG